MKCPVLCVRIASSPHHIQYGGNEIPLHPAYVTATQHLSVGSPVDTRTRQLLQVCLRASVEGLSQWTLSVFIAKSSATVSPHACRLLYSTRKSKRARRPVSCSGIPGRLVNEPSVVLLCLGDSRSQRQKLPIEENLEQSIYCRL